MHAGSERLPVVYIRFPASARSGIGAAVLAAVEALGYRLRRRFVVVQPGRVRVVD